MSDKQFYEGQKLKSVFWHDEGVIAVGKYECVSITVVMENGQMAPVPWAQVEFTCKTSKYNLALAEGVELFDKPTNTIKELK